jgi:hypothetical protein
MIAYTKPTYGSKALAEGAYDEINVLLNADLFSEPTAPLTENPQRVSLIYQETGSVFVLQFSDISQHRPITEHAVNPFHNNQGVFCTITESFQALVKIICIVVLEKHELSPAQTAPIINARMTVRVYQNDIAGAGQRSQHAQIGGIPG